MSFSKLLITISICLTIFSTGCQQNIQSTIESEVAASVEKTIEARPSLTPNPTFTPNPTLTLLPTNTPVTQPTQIPTHTAQPTYTPNPTYTPIIMPTAEIIDQAAPTNNTTPPSNGNTSDNATASPFTASYIKVTLAKMTQILASVSGYQSTYHDDNPDDLYSGDGGREKVPVNCHAALNQYQELQQLEIKSADNLGPEQQAAFGFYRRGWDQYTNVIIPVIERCQTAVSNQETLDTIGDDLYYGATAVLRGSVKDLFNQAIYSLEDN